MSYAALRRRNKEELVDLAFSVFSSKAQVEGDLKTQWVERLLNGYDFNKFIQKLKNSDELIHYTEDKRTLTESKVGSIKIVDSDLEFNVGLKRKLNVKLINTSQDSFKTSLNEPLNASYHWYDFNKNTYIFDGVRTPLPEEVKSNDELIFGIDVIAPSEPGNYLLMVTLIMEGQAWWEERGLDVYLQPLEVLELKGPGMTRRAQQIYAQLKSKYNSNTLQEIVA